LGTLQISLAVVIIVVITLVSPPSRNYSQMLLGVSISCLVLLMIPGVLSIVFAAFIRQRQRWAVISMIVLASLELLVLAPFLLRSLFSLPRNLAPLAVIGLFLAALILLIVQLSRCFGALRIDAIDYDRGFAPIMPAQTFEGPDAGNNQS
jgi:predicted Na+-dependent transporter